MTFYVHPSSRIANCWDVRADTLLGDYGLATDTYRTRATAEHYCRLLNKGLATVEQHALAGCRIVPVISTHALRESFGVAA